jgi:hypothetical protein
VVLGRRKHAPVVVFSPEYNHQILTHPDILYSLDVNSPDSPIQMPQNTAASRLLSGVAGMNGARHMQHRRMLMPAFHKKRAVMIRLDDRRLAIVSRQFGNACRNAFGLFPPDCAQGRIGRLKDRRDVVLTLSMTYEIDHFSSCLIGHT